MKQHSLTLGLLAGLIFVSTIVPASAASFKTLDDCHEGARVADQQGKTGTITHVDHSASLCDVRLDGTGEIHYYLFWMLHAAGGSAETNDKLVAGTYECYADQHYTFMNVKVTGPGTYATAGSSGRFRVLPSRQIVFTSGPLSKYHAKLLDGPSIGLNTNGSSFYATTCDLKKS